MPVTGPIKLSYVKNDFIKRLGDNQLKIWANKKLYGNMKYENNILSFEKTFLHSYYFIVTVKDRGKDILVQKVNKEDFLYTYRKDKFSLNLLE